MRVITNLGVFVICVYIYFDGVNGVILDFFHLHTLILVPLTRRARRGATLTLGLGAGLNGNIQVVIDFVWSFHSLGARIRLLPLFQNRVISSVRIVIYMLGFLLQSCGHTCRSRGDIHPLCWRCAESRGIPLCTPQQTCEVCIDFKPAVWRRILDARRKRLRSSISHAVSAAMSQASPEQVVNLEEEEEEEEVVSILPFQPAEEGPLAIPSQEEVMKLAHQSDTTESYGRAEVQDSDSETDVASECSELPLTQQVVETEDKVPSSRATPTLRPEDIEFPDLLRWVARNSNFDATAPPPKLDEEVLFESEVRPDQRGSDFLQLSPSPAIRALAERRAKEAQAKEKEGLPTIGKVPPTTVCRVPMRQYSLSGEEILKSAPTWAPERPDWISKVKPITRLYITDADAARLDTSARESLVILSNLDAVTSALQRTITDTDALSVPFILRALQFVGGGLADLARLSTCSSHQLSLHRRDAALWEAKSRRITSRQLATLRHAPFLASQYVFDPEVVQHITEERQEDAQKRAIMRVATAPLQSSRPQTHVHAKRSLSLQSTPQSAAKKFRKQASPRRIPAAQGAPTQATTSSPARPASKSHR